VPAVLLGEFLVLPTIYGLLGESGILGTDFSRAADGYDNLLVLSFFALAPAVYAYGTRLEFSVGRFIAAAVLLAFMAIRAAIQAAPFGSGMMIPLGGGLLGIGVVAALGYSGLWLGARIDSVSPRTRRSLAAGLGVTGVGVLLFVLQRFETNLRYGIVGLGAPPTAVVEASNEVVEAEREWAIGNWYCDNRHSGPDGTRTWLSSLYIGNGETTRYRYDWTDKFEGRWVEGQVGTGERLGTELTLWSSKGGKMTYRYSEEPAPWGKLTNAVRNGDTEYVSVCCFMYACSEYGE
jgi:hypothetical protein